MAESIEVYLQERESGRLVLAEIHVPASAEDRKAVESTWYYSTGRSTIEPYFDWPTKFASLKAAPEKLFFSVVCGGFVQGVMLVGGPRAARSQPSALQLEVAFLETAPWNRRGVPKGRRKRYKGVGTILLAAAAFWSRYRVHCEGRVGLLSVPSAVGFYRLWMTRLEPNALGDQLVNFEMTPEQASELLREVGVE